MHSADRLAAPWTPEQVASINGYQESGAGHPFTCGVGACRGTGPAERHGRPVLCATGAGWVCPVCGYTQDWALAFMAGRSWEQAGGWPLYVLTTAREVDIV